MTDDEREAGDRDGTSDLLDRARAGDQSALNQLFERHVPVLRRWASGRLPRWARDIADTPDLVQETVLETLKHLDRFEHRGEGALPRTIRSGSGWRNAAFCRRHRRPLPADPEGSALRPTRYQPWKKPPSYQSQSR